MKWIAALIIVLECAAAGVAAAEEKTIITGDQMEIIRNGEKVVFSGNSKVSQGKNVLKARRIVQEKKRDRVEAEGNVTFYTVTQDSEPLNGRAEKAFFNTATGEGELWEGRPSVMYQARASTGPVHLNADRIRISRARQEIQAEGGVEIITSSATALAPRAVFLQNDKKAVLSGQAAQPEIRYKDPEQRGNYFADTITLFMNDRHVIMDGNVNGKIYFVSKSSAVPAR